MNINLCPPAELLLVQMGINLCPPAGLLADQTDINLCLPTELLVEHMYINFVFLINSYNCDLLVAEMDKKMGSSSKTLT